MKKWAMIFFFISFSVFADSALISKVIQLQYVDADKVISLVQPLLQEGEAVSGSGQTLVVKVQPDTLTQIRNLLHKIDTPPVTFEVSIYQGPADWLQNDQSTVSYSTSMSETNMQKSQSVKVMNGESAFVSTDSEAPIVSSVGVGFWTGVNYQQHPIKKGLLVEPTLQGQQVKLKVRRIREDQNQLQGTQQFDSQQTDTTLMVPMNQWVLLSSAEGAVDPDNNNNSVSYSTGNQYSQSSTLYVKVNVVGR